MKPCSKCHVSQPDDNYGMNGRWRKGICKSCNRAYKRNRARNYEADNATKHTRECLAFNKLYRAWPIVQ